MVPEQPVSIVFGHIGGLVLSMEVSTNDSTDLLANFWKGLTEKKRGWRSKREQGGRSGFADTHLCCDFSGRRG